MSAKLNKIGAIIGLVFAGICFLYGIQLFWMGALPLINPGYFGKGAPDLGLHLGMAAIGVVLTAIGWLVIKKSEAAWDGRSRQRPRQRAQKW